MPLSQAAPSRENGSLCTTVAQIPAVTALAQPRTSMPGSVALSGSLETVGINRVVMHRHPLERASSEQREDRIEDRSGHFNRHHDLLAEIAALRQGLDAQRAQLTAVSEQVQASGFASALEALRSDLAELRHQQDLQAGALRDGLMEIHQHRAELVELQNLRREDAAAD